MEPNNEIGFAKSLRGMQRETLASIIVAHTKLVHFDYFIFMRRLEPYLRIRQTSVL